MRIANLLFASAAFADKNIDQLTNKVRIVKIFFQNFTKIGKNDSVSKTSLILISQVTIKQYVKRYPVRFWCSKICSKAIFVKNSMC